MKIVQRARTIDGRFPYFGRPTKMKDTEYNDSGGAMALGLVTGLLLGGPLGFALAGSAIGAAVGAAMESDEYEVWWEQGKLLSETCRRCASTMHVSKINDVFIFQCEQCGLYIHCPCNGVTNDNTEPVPFRLDDVPFDPRRRRVKRSQVSTTKATRSKATKATRSKATKATKAIWRRPRGR